MKNRKYTKWIPFGNYNHGASEIIVFARKNLRTGMISFKTKTANKRLMSQDTFIPADLIDVRKAWDELIKSE
jgi:hypothetical protein